MRALPGSRQNVRVTPVFSYMDALVPVSAVIVLSCVRAAIPDGQPA
jgi:hypothetical protein